MAGLSNIFDSLNASMVDKAKQNANQASQLGSTALTATGITPTDIVNASLPTTSAYTPAQVRNVAEQLNTEIGKVQAQTKALDPVVREVSKQASADLVTAKQQVEAGSNAIISKALAERDSAFAAASLNQQTLQRFDSQLNNPEAKKTEELAAKAQQQAAQRLAEAQLTTMNGGVFDKLAGLFTVPFKQQDAQIAQANYNNIMQTKAQLTAQLITDLETNGRLANAPFAHEIARTTYNSTVAKTLAESAMTKASIGSSQLDVIGKTMQLSDSGIQLLNQKLNAMQAANITEKSAYDAAIQQIQLADSYQRFTATNKKLKDDASFTAMHEANFAEFQRDLGIKDVQTFTNSMLMAEKSGKTPDLLGRYIMHSEYVAQTNGNAVSRAIIKAKVGGEGSDFVDPVAQDAQKFVSTYMPAKYTEIRKAKLDAALQSKQSTVPAEKRKDVMLDQKELQKAEADAVAEFSRYQVYGPNGEVNMEAARYWDTEYNNFVKDSNTSINGAVQAGLRTFGDLTTALNSSKFADSVRLAVGDDAVFKWMMENKDTKILTDIESTGDAGKALKANVAAMLSTIPNEVLNDNAATMDYINKASRSVAALYKTKRKVQGDVTPGWTRSIVKLTSQSGSEIGINLENPADLSLLFMEQLSALRMQQVQRNKSASPVLQGPFAGALRQ